MIRMFTGLFFGFFLIGGLGSAVADSSQDPFWISGIERDAVDYYAAFRGRFTMAEAKSLDCRLLGASWYVVSLDGVYLTEGPPRFPIDHPEYQDLTLDLPSGDHVLAIEVHYEGVSTRMLENIPPFLWCVLLDKDTPVPVDWKCHRLEGYAAKVNRVNAQFGWMEWCDTRRNPADWEKPDFEDASWDAPVRAEVKLGAMKPLSSGEVKRFVQDLHAVAEGTLVEQFGYERDNIGARFFLRDLAAADLPPQGLWKRYDLGRVRLGRPELTLDLPEGAVVEIAYSESLAHGRVNPWITLSASDSCNMDHFVARGGRQTFFPMTPKGGRYVEVHVLASPAAIRFVQEKYMERCYYDRPEGAFASEDPLLNQIWSVGIETHRACSEDALIDNPTRERGQWAGDVVSVGMDIAAAGYTDLRLCRRGLVQCAQCARKDGMVAGLCPGGAAYLSTYAAQWVSACLHYWELTGDKRLLEELYPAAEANLAAFRKYEIPEGISDESGWGFVDWGYVRNDGPSDMGVNLHYLAALRDMLRWCDALGKGDDREKYAKEAEQMTAVVRGWFAAQYREGKPDWDRIGYHRTVLGVRLGFFKEAEIPEAIAYIRRHMESCFPNNPAAPRLSDPAQNQAQLITPYFAHYAMPVLIEHGAMDFVLDQYRKCWGWMLEEGRSTWVEVFDTRWSHCHQWAGCPTWQLTRYALGLTPRFDRGARHFSWMLCPGSLKQAEGRIPVPGTNGEVIAVFWRIGDDGGLLYTLEAPAPITLCWPDGGEREVSGKEILLFKAIDGGWRFEKEVE